MHEAATMLMRSFARAGRALPAIKGRGSLAIALSSLLLKAGANHIVQCKMAAGHRLQLDCRVPGHCWAFFSGKYDDERPHLEEHRCQSASDQASGGEHAMASLQFSPQ